jgi:hypothetical protein
MRRKHAVQRSFGAFGSSHQSCGSGAPDFFTDDEFVMSDQVDMPNVFDYVLNLGYMKNGLNTNPAIIAAGLAFACADGQRITPTTPSAAPR